MNQWRNLRWCAGKYPWRIPGGKSIKNPWEILDRMLKKTLAKNPRSNPRRKSRKKKCSNPWMSLEGISGEISEGIQIEVPEKVPEEILQGISDGKRGKNCKGFSGKIRKVISWEINERFVRGISKRIPNEISLRIPERILNKSLRDAMQNPESNTSGINYYRILWRNLMINPGRNPWGILGKKWWIFS